METLKELGTIAGIAGIAVGAMVLVFKDTLNGALGPARAYRLRMYIVTATFSVVVLSIVIYFAAPILASFLVPQDCKPSEVVGECKKRLAAVEKVHEAAKALEKMQSSRGIKLSPALTAYLVDPSPDRWKDVREEAQNTYDDLSRAADAVFDYDPALLSPILREMKSGLMGKADILKEIIATQSPPDISVASRYKHELSNIMSLIDDDIRRLEHSLQRPS